MPVAEPVSGNEGRSLARRACLFFAGVLVGFLVVFSLLIYLFATTPGPSADTKQIEVVIHGNTGLRQISRILAENGVISDATRFSLLAVLTGSARKLRAGEYAFQPGRTPSEVLADLVAGRVMRRPVTVPEGSDIFQVAAILDRGGWADKERFLALLRDAAFIKGLDLDVESLEGYLFPDTYLLSRGQQGEADIIRMMVRRTTEVLAELQEGTGTGLTRHEVLTLASIVEKETALADERPLVARVFLNRLAMNMPLQADPTVLYGRREGDSRDITRSDLVEYAPYNTYMITGLPPGPICNPGRAAIEAVHVPADGSFLYFVAKKGDGSHVFSTTLAEHNKAVSTYRQ